MNLTEGLNETNESLISDIIKINKVLLDVPLSIIYTELIKEVNNKNRVACVLRKYLSNNEIKDNLRNSFASDVRVVQNILPNFSVGSIMEDLQEVITKECRLQFVLKKYFDNEVKTMKRTLEDNQTTPDKKIKLENNTQTSKTKKVNSSLLNILNEYFPNTNIEVFEKICHILGVVLSDSSDTLDLNSFVNDVGDFMFSGKTCDISQPSTSSYSSQVFSCKTENTSLNSSTEEDEYEETTNCINLKTSVKTEFLQNSLSTETAYGSVDSVNYTNSVKTEIQEDLSQAITNKTVEDFENIVSEIIKKEPDSDPENLNFTYSETKPVSSVPEEHDINYNDDECLNNLMDKFEQKLANGFSCGVLVGNYCSSHLFQASASKENSKQTNLKHKKRVSNKKIKKKSNPNDTFIIDLTDDSDFEENKPIKFVDLSNESLDSDNSPLTITNLSLCTDTEHLIDTDDGKASTNAALNVKNEVDLYDSATQLYNVKEILNLRTVTPTIDILTNQNWEDIANVIDLFSFDRVVSSSENRNGDNLHKNSAQTVNNNLQIYDPQNNKMRVTENPPVHLQPSTSGLSKLFANSSVSTVVENKENNPLHQPSTSGLNYVDPFATGPIDSDDKLNHLSTLDCIPYVPAASFHRNIPVNVNPVNIHFNLKVVKNEQNTTAPPSPIKPDLQMMLDKLGLKATVTEDQKIVLLNGSKTILEPTPGPSNIHFETTYCVQKHPFYSKLMEMFPDICPQYLQNICQDKENKPEVLNKLVSRLLKNDYPVRERVFSPPTVLDYDEQLQMLQELFPEADPTYLELQCEKLIDDPERFKQFVVDNLENKSYPTKEEYRRKLKLSAQEKQYTTEFNINNFLEIIQNPKEYFSKPDRPSPLNYNSNMFSYSDYENYTLQALRNHYNRISVTTINCIFRVQAKKNILKAVKLLNKCNSSIRAKRKPVPLPSCDNIPLLQEIAYALHKNEIKKYIQKQQYEKKVARVTAKACGQMKTCGCCFDEEVMPKDIIMCDYGHIFCKECVKKSAEVLIGEGKLEFPCLQTCESHFSLQILQNVLKPNVFSRMAQRKQLEEVKAAGIEDLESCPFCDFASIPVPDDKIFRCFNEECMKETCRLCREPSHIPLRCEEVEKDRDVKARTYIEDKMTEALIRRCYKCNMKFIKEGGCNKMTCSCGAMMCYICNKPVKDYKHFNGQGGDQYHLCPLYSDTIKLHADAVLRGAQMAKHELGLQTNELKIDPTMGIDQHYVEEMRKRNMDPNNIFGEYYD